ncbi:MAG: hypothetical protein JW821_00480 [Deltaproteobacteria bacterium]|nr:hypothetical protein [Deltaproteobacteria bacterium]
MLGVVTDIGLDGLGFHYMAEERESIGPFDLDLFMRGAGYILKQIPVEAVEDIGLENDVAFSSVLMKRCEVRFLGLSDEHMSRLKDFIGNHTLGLI